MGPEEFADWLSGSPWWLKVLWATVILGMMLCAYLWREGDR